jgi:hypothetical protein
MAIKLIIQGTPIEFPSSGSSPNWAPGVIEAIQALADAVNSITGAYDVPPQVQNIDQNNLSTNVEVNNMIFPFQEVRGATVFYTVYRKTENSGPPDGVELAEAGTIQIVFNNANPTNNKWEIQREYVGNAKISFNITDVGQMRFSTEEITGINHNGVLSFRAIAILNE